MEKELLNHKNLNAFKQHGFIPENVSNGQVCGYSIFSKKNSMYINPQTKMWDCKVSGKSGGFKTWINEIVKFCQSNISKNIGPLVRDRGLLRKTIKNNGIGYNPETDKYIVPIKDGDNKNYSDIKIYDMNSKRKDWKFISTSGMTNSLYGQELISQSNGTIWLCEGEWDALVMREILEYINRSKDICLAVSGGTTFKQEWHSIFKDRDVRVLYDHDKTGWKGQNKVHKALSMLVKSILYVHWGDVENNFDLRDFYNVYDRDAKKSFNKLTSLLEQTPHPLAEEDQEEEQIETERLDGKFVQPRIVYNEYKQWLHLPDTTVIDVMFGSMIANRLPGDPLWLFIVAPSGATKTEFLLSISDAPFVVTTTSMTPHSLISGANKGSADPSLIPRLNGKILAIKDFTTVLNMNMMAREEIFGILRDAYDGKTEKYFGNGVIRSYNSLFGLVAGVTPAIDMYTTGQTALGERFLKFRVPVNQKPKGAIQYLKRAMTNSNSEEDMRRSLREIGKRVLSYEFKDIPNIPSNIKEKLIYFAYWTSQMRGTVVRDSYTGDQLYAPFVELGTRLTKQYTKLIQGIGMFRGLSEVNETEANIIKDIAIGSVPENREKIVRAAYSHVSDEKFSIDELKKWSRLPVEIIRKHSKDLLALDILKNAGKEGRSQLYKFNSEFLQIMVDSDIY